MALLMRRLLPTVAPSLSPALRGLGGVASSAEALGYPGARWFSAAGEAGNIVDITTNDEYKAAVSSGSLVVADFTASWCGPCRQIAPHFEKMSLEHTSAKFLKIDIDSEELRDTVVSESISAVPTFILYKNGAKVDQVMGADINKLRSSIEENV